MTYTTRTPEEIERDIERDRAALTSNLETLQEKLSFDGIFGQFSDQLREHGGDITQTISRTVRDNPAAVALTGLGLAWLAFGRKSDRTPSHTAAQPEEPQFVGSRGAAQHGASLSRPDPRFKGGTEGLPSWALDHDEDDQDEMSYKERLADAASSLRDTAQSGVEDVKSGVASGLSAVKDQAEKLKARIAEGTENLPEEARNRVIMARENAVVAKRKAAEAMANSSQKVGDIFERQPLVVGALALAVGAAIGSAAPRTRKEDELLGAHSDKLMRDAERMFHEEKAKASAVLAAARDEVKTIAEETRDDLNSGAPGDQSAVEAVADQAKSAGKRVANAAKQKAQDEKLGKVS